MPASSGLDSASVSWPTIACCFSSRRTRCASTPNGPQAERPLRRPIERVPDVRPVVGRDVDLEAELAHEADAQDDRRDAGHAALGGGQVGHRLARDVEVGHVREDVAGPRPGEVDRRELPR